MAKIITNLNDIKEDDGIPEVLIDPSTLTYAQLRDEITKMSKKLEADSAHKLSALQKSRPVFSMGSFGLDCGLGRVDPVYGNGGVPERSIVEIFGPPGVYKSGTFHHMIRSVQQRGLIVYLILSEEQNYEHMESLGIDMEALQIFNCYDPQHRELKYATAERRLRDLVRASMNPLVGMVGIDTIKGMSGMGQVFDGKGVTTASDRPFDKSDTAIRANFMEKFFNRIKLFNKRAIVGLVNQTNESITEKYVLGPELKGYTSGGRRKEFEAVIRINVDSRPLYDKDEHDVFDNYHPQIGWEVQYRILKNKFSSRAGARRLTSKFYFDGTGFDDVDQVVRYGAYLGMIRHSGAYYYFKSKKKDKNGKAIEKSCQGLDQAKEFLKAHPLLLAAMKKRILLRTPELFSHRSKEKVRNGLATAKVINARIGEGSEEEAA